MTGTCSGWVAYSFLTKDPYVLAGSAPGLIVSLWLNFGAIKLQYNPDYEIEFDTSIVQQDEQPQQHQLDQEGVGPNSSTRSSTSGS